MRRGCGPATCFRCSSATRRRRAGSSRCSICRPAMSAASAPPSPMSAAPAWQLMRARVYDHYERLKHAERREKRAAMIGSGERSERIRTYRWKENIVVDHRLEQSFSLQKALGGGLDEIVEALIAHDRSQ